MIAKLYSRELNSPTTMKDSEQVRIFINLYMGYSIYYERFVMSVHSLIESWLSETTLVMGGSRTLNGRFLFHALRGHYPDFRGS